LCINNANDISTKIRNAVLGKPIVEIIIAIEFTPILRYDFPQALNWEEKEDSLPCRLHN